MARRNYNMDQKKIDRYIKEGRGQGKKENYKPWITVQDFASDGRISRCFSWKTGRMHEFMSDNELRYFYLMLWSDSVIDIREQYPILDRDAVMKISEEKAIRYPVDVKSKTPLILTTDFMLTVLENGKEVNVARTIKPWKDLDKKRVIEKLEIEKEYYKVEGIDWGIVTEKEIPKIFALNVEWVYSAHKLEATNEVGVSILNNYAELLKDNIYKNKDEIIEKLLTQMDNEYNLEAGTFLYLFKHLISTKQIKVIDMNKKINVASVVKNIIEIK
ncbi:TnsA endonuclease C-terminal domain-containing protein [Clostridium saccharoperbutylacetonicum]|uniref:TnsA endonuclease C-terminal domain-containing protein n=1 Tax=Clostridium saccharoperbutylacetonicum TaxID=36745 RepID=UPI0039ED7F2D